MLKVIGIAILSLVLGYIAGLVGGLWLVNTFSPNRHDKALEAAMTSAFVIGPICAVLAVAAALGILYARSQP